MADYQAGSKNWGLATNDNGELFAANNSGLLHFNGERWRLYRLPNETVIRSVACVGDRVYTGSYEEFGYWQQDSRGRLVYTSLTQLIRGHEFTSEEFWQILPAGDSIWFRSFSTIYRYNGSEIEVINPPFVVNSLVLWNNRILMAGSHNTIYRIDGKDLVPEILDPALEGRVVVDMEVVGDALYIGTKLDGCFIYQGGQLKPMNRLVNGALREFQLNQILALPGGTVAFGTIKGGVILYDSGSDDWEMFSREEGMLNNTVLSFARFRDQLWVGLDNGIDRFSLNSHLRFYTDYSGVLGTTYDMIQKGGTLFLGTNTGVYYLDGQGLQFVPGSQDQVWDLSLVGDDLLCGHNMGTYKVEPSQFHRISDVAGGYMMLKVPESEEYMQGTYVGLACFRNKDPDGWEVRYIPGFQQPVKYITFENERTLWAAHSYKGVYRIRLNEDRTSIDDISEVTAPDLPSIYNVKLYNIKNQIILQSQGHWFRFDPIEETIGPFEEFAAYDGMNLLYFDDRHFWFANQEDSRAITITDLRAFQLILDDQELQRRLASESEKVIRENDSTYYITLNDGFARLDFNAFVSQAQLQDLPVPKLYKIADSKKLYPLDSVAHFPNQNAREIEWAFAAPSLTQARYQYVLSGPLSQRGVTESGSLRFQNLPHGSYTLEVRTIRIGNHRSEPVILEFEVLPPWYLTYWSLGLYGLAGFGLVMGVRAYNRKKYQKKKKRLEMEFQNEQSAHMARLEQERLGHEIREKQNELTRSAMDVARKNELILELKNMLVSSKGAIGNPKRYQNFMKKLNNSINDREDWKRFELNFKELHEDFFETLLEHYPELTPKDLKLCAYLKMNLASKEIAPLMGISVRGVEIHRYRLRKKLRLDSAQNISNFLITLKQLLL